MDRGASGIVAQMAEETLGVMVAVTELARVPSRLLEPRSDDTSTTSSSSTACQSNSDHDSCEKPVGSKTFTLPIVLGVVLPIAGAFIVFFILHRRHVRKQRQEDLNDRHASMDFGLGDVQRPGRPKKGQMAGTVQDVDMKEKGSLHAKQRSMDIMLDSPYLLPPDLQGSRESLHSLSRTIHQHEDPYRPVTQAYGDNMSVRSASRFGHDNASMYTASSHGPARMHDLAAVEPHGPLSRASIVSASYRQGSLPLYSVNPNLISPIEKDKPSSQPTPPPEVHLPRMTSPEPMGDEKSAMANSSGDLIAPAPTINRDSSLSTSAAIRQSNNYLGALITSIDGAAHPTPASPNSPKADEPVLQSPPNPVVTLPVHPRPIRKESIPVLQHQESDHKQPDSQAMSNASITPLEDAKRASRYSLDFTAQDSAQAGLAAPGFDTRRLSVGLRPLPPNTIMDNDNPEVRANRIRSFYKEYFVENKPPARGQYYEDYDQNYLGDAAYYDPGRNKFVMPYAQPVTRRAMTPPPRAAPRFQGAPRALHGSMGGMGIQGGRPPQDHSPQHDGSRAASTASHRGRSASVRPTPPPAALNSLPTPSKLKVTRLL